MDTVQQLRAKAYAAGTLTSNQQLVVSREGTIIIIQPYNPQVVYVPVYDPWVIYGPWWWPLYPPYVVYRHPPDVVIAPRVIWFGVGFSVGTFWGHGWGHWDWGHRRVYVNVNRTVNINRTTIINTREIGTTTWHHNREHRRGVAYRVPATRERFAPTNRRAVDYRRIYRGYEQSRPTMPSPGVSRPAPDTRPGQDITRPVPETRSGSAAVQRPAPKSRPAPGVSRPAPDIRPSPDITRPAPATRPGSTTVQRPAPKTRPEPGVSQPAHSTPLYGIARGSQIRKESARGHESLSSSRRAGSLQPAPARQAAPARGGVQRGGKPAPLENKGNSRK